MVSWVVTQSSDVVPSAVSSDSSLLTTNSAVVIPTTQEVPGSSYDFNSTLHASIYTQSSVGNTI